MKNKFTLALSLLGILGGGATVHAQQCNFTGLDNYYCADSSAVDSLVGNGGGFYGTGMYGNAFDPSAAAPGEVDIWYTEYTIDTNNANYNLDTVTGTQVFLSDDQVSGNLPIGFNFEFFGVTYNEFYISSNGFIAFELQGSGCCTGLFIPNDDANNNLIATAWEDLNPPAGGLIDYRTDSSGGPGNYRLIVRYVDVMHYSTGNPVNTQIHLYEGSNIIEIHTDTIDGTSNGIHTMGIENHNGTAAYARPGRNNSNWYAGNDFVRFTPCTSMQTTFVGPYVGFEGDTMSVCGELMVPFTYTSYDWSTGSTNQTATITNTGYVSVTVTDLLGCMLTDSAFVDSVYPAVAVTANVTDESAGSSNGAIAQTVTGGSGVFTYSWNTGQTTKNISGLAQGTYTVTITDSLGCVEVRTYTVGLVDGINELIGGVSVYPNPSKGVFQLTSELGYKANYFVTDIAGKQLFDGTVNTTSTIDITRQPSGMYILYVQTEQGLVRAKLIKQ